MKLKNVDKGEKAHNKEEVVKHLQEGRKCYVVQKHGFLGFGKKTYTIFIPTKRGRVMVSEFDPSEEEYEIVTNIGKDEDLHTSIRRVLG